MNNRRGRAGGAALLRCGETGREFGFCIPSVWLERESGRVFAMVGPLGGAPFSLFPKCTIRRLMGFQSIRRMLFYFFDSKGRTPRVV